MKKYLIILLSILFPLLIQAPASAMTMPIKVTYRESVVNIASQYIGVRYCRGGESPRCFDCSGLTQFVYSQVGVELPRLGGSQLRHMNRIPVSEAQPGDLVFFSTKGGYIYHVGIYIGEGKMIHSPKPGRKVTISPVFKRAIYATYPLT